jgi:Flp pilus assembly protein TadD
MGWRAQPMRACVVVAAAALAISVAGCQTDGANSSGSWADVFTPASEPVITPTVQDPADVQYFPSDEPLRLGMEHFNRGHYGIAERYFRDAVEKAPKDVTAWVGLAATYDRIGRFDLADRAYASAIRLVGETTDILNNLGYSYMLRGDYAAARKKYILALKREPHNPTILNNLWLLDSSHHALGRSPDVEKY